MNIAGNAIGIHVNPAGYVRVTIIARLRAIVPAR